MQFNNEIYKMTKQFNNYKEIKLTNNVKTNIDILIAIVDKTPNDANMLNWVIIKVLDMFNNKININEIYKLIDPIILDYISTYHYKDGIKYLTKIDPIISHIVINNIKNPKDLIEDEIIFCAQRRSYHIFNYWWKYAKLKKMNNTDFKIKILYESIHNSDDRILKYILSEIKEINNIYYKKIFGEILSCKQKYIFDKMHILSKHIDFSLHFNDFICEIYQTYEDYFYEKLFKYYYKFPLLIKTIGFLYENKINVINIYDILLTTNEKMACQFYSIIYHRNNIDIDYSQGHICPKDSSQMHICPKDYNYKKWENFIINNFDYLLYMDHLDRILLVSKYFNKFNNLIIKILKNNQLIEKIINLIIFDKYLNNNIYSSILLLTRFYVFDDLESINRKYITTITNMNIKCNFILHKLRLWAKRYKKNKFITHKAIMQNVLYEIENYVPNDKLVLKNGSLKYQLSRQAFNIEPPKDLNKDDLSKLKNYLIRENVKGIQVNSVPFDIYPECELLNNYKIKAIYNEELELYIIIDIDIPNTTIIERNELLWSYHNNFEIKTINNLDEFNKYLEKDKNNLKLFLDKYDSIKWYPIKLFNIIHNETIEKQLSFNIIIKKLNDPAEFIYN